MPAVPSRLPTSCVSNTPRVGSPLSPSSSPSSASPTEPHDDDADSDKAYSPALSGHFNRLTFSVGFPHLTKPSPPNNSASLDATAIQTQTISLYFDTSFVPGEPLFAVFDHDGLVSCTSSPPSQYAPVPFSPYTAITSHTIVHFSSSPRSRRRRRRRRLVLSSVCLAATLLLCFLAIGLFVLLNLEPFPTTTSRPDAALPVVLSPLPLQDNFTRILYLHDEALVPLAIPTDHYIDNKSNKSNSNATSLALLASLHNQVTDFCLVLTAQAPADTDIIQYFNRVCGWVSDAMRDLRVAWMQASTFYNNSMSFSTPHWLQSLARALDDTPRGSSHDTSTRAVAYTADASDDTTRTSKYILTTMLGFLDPESKEGLLPRSLRKGHAVVNQILPSADTLKGEIDRLMALADEHGVVPDANAQPSQTNKPSSIWQSCRLLVLRDSSPLNNQGQLGANWTDAAIKGDKAMLGVHASRMLAQLTQTANNTIKALESQVADTGARFHDAEKALDDMSGALRALLDTLMSSEHGTTSTPDSPWLATCKRAINEATRWLSSMITTPRRSSQKRQATPWITQINSHDDISTVDRRPCDCASAHLILWYVPDVDGLISHLREKARSYAV